MTALAWTLALWAALGPAVGEPKLRWVERSGRPVAEVVGLDPRRLELELLLHHADPQQPEILTVRVARPKGEPEAAAMVGRLEVEGGMLRFSPRYPLLPGIRYLARFRPGNEPPIEVVYTPPDRPVGPPTRIVAVYPTPDRVPANLLKLYLHFSAPMSRGEAYRRIRLVDAGGRPVDHPFLEIGEELWNGDGTRLTLLFDPGRVKRGLVPREEDGPILEAGKTYRLVVDAGWPDASGRPLAAEFRKEFRAGPPDTVQPSLSSWAFDVPAAGTRDPLVVRFPEPLDRAMLGRSILVEASGTIVAGRIEVGPGETSWRFLPERPWPSGPLALRVDTELEDLAGNSIARPFEVDVVRAPGPGADSTSQVVPVPRR